MPLDYFHAPKPPTDEEIVDAQRRAGTLPRSADRVREAFGGRDGLVAVPAEFDALLDVVGDAATTGAIEAALRRADIGVFRGRDASARSGPIELHVRSADLDRARDLARAVIERRGRFGS